MRWEDHQSNMHNLIYKGAVLEKVNYKASTGKALEKRQNKKGFTHYIAFNIS
ncbi:hypothetical protein P9D80_08575 [Bacillus spizizenii]|uniref:hypothetical protein n=1 Tax=Bacillus spizizenii TaxID=96241 RepID=UPI002DBA3DEE|nr:hypothetical protein [Bacillus spizizenii]MEC1585377.1 hypothetical protein [Bacillus spizizenii]